MDILTPEALKRLVERADRFNMIMAARAHGSDSRAEDEAPLVTQLAAAISALMEQLSDAKSDYARRHKDACDRQEKLIEIAEIASNTDKRGWNDFDRIATIARSTGQGGEG